MSNLRPTPEELRELFAYNPETGELRWTKRPSALSRARVGGIAGNKKSDKKPYRVVSIGNRKYAATSIIWAIQTGQWPEVQIDHIDTYGPKMDFGDRWENLRLSTNSDNQKNRKLASNNTSGYPGVFWSSRDRVWRAAIMLHQKHYYLGSFKSFEDAVLARKKAETEMFGEYKPLHRI